MIPDPYLRSTSAAALVFAAAFCFMLMPDAADAEEVAAVSLVTDQAKTFDNKILPQPDLIHLDHALRLLNMDRDDLAFARDHAKETVALDHVRRLLNDPLLLPVEGDNLLRALADNDVPISLVNEWLSLQPVNEGVSYKALALNSDQPLSPKFSMTLEAFTYEAERIRHGHDNAIPLKPNDKQRLAADLASAILHLEDNAKDRETFLAAGMPQSEIERLLADSRNPDPEPSVRTQLALLDKIDQSQLVMAGVDFYRAVHGLAEHMKSFDKDDWPKKVVTVQLRGGRTIMIGTRGNDRYDQHALLIIDPGGNDSYTGHAAAVGPTANGPLAAVIDFEGNDTYKSDALFSAGTAFLGTTVVIDYAGNDYWATDHMGQASAYGGCAFLIDYDGHDHYRATKYAQASATYGFAVLADHAGSDRYDLGLAGQAYSGYRGAAILVDRSGNDVYVAGGEQNDFGRHDDRYLTLAQGFSIGMRPFVGGGWAALVDLAGNDTYKADIYGQGVSYWYSVGMLLDRSGNDTYSMHQYGQGSGIHLSLGLLADLKGNDTYSSFVLAQGNAHDYAVGMLFDHEGNDTYTADHHSQGRALNNAFGLLMDRSGNDAYFGRDNKQCQGVGNGGGHRRYGSVGILCDLAGQDQYSSGAKNDAKRLRPLYGIIYDVEKAK